ncbi:MAG: LolA family protein [Pelotomaculum sp.]
MKRNGLFYLLLLLVVAMLSLMGCSGGKDNSSQPAGQPASNSAGQGAAEDSVESLFGKGKQVEGMSYDYVMTFNSTTVNSKVWVEGDKVKTDSVVEGQNIISIVDGDTFYTYFPAENRAMKMTMAAEQENGEKTETPIDFIEDVDDQQEQYKIVETTMYDGVECKVIVVTGADGKEQSKMWVRTDYGIPIRIESVDPSEEKTIMEFKNLKIGKQPADTFQLPAGVEIIDASDLFNNLPR